MAKQYHLDPRFHLAFIPVTGLKCSQDKSFSPLTEIAVGKTEASGTESAHPLISTHGKFYREFRGKQGEITETGSYKETFKVMLHDTIRNDDFQRNTALQHCCDIVQHGYNIVPALQHCSTKNRASPRSRINTWKISQRIQRQARRDHGNRAHIKRHLR